MSIVSYSFVKGCFHFPRSSWLAYCSKSIMAIIIHLHTLPKKFNMINVFGNLPYLIQPPVISSFVPWSLINLRASNLSGNKMFIWWDYPEKITQNIKFKSDLNRCICDLSGVKKKLFSVTYKAKSIECYVFHFWFRYYYKYYKN